MFKGKYLVLVFLSNLLVACSQSGDQSGPPVFVTMAPVKTQAWQSNVEATGSITAIQGSQLKSEVAGRITKIYFKPGQQVHLGDPLIDINPTVLAAQYKALQATAILQQANYARARKLYREKVISKADMDQALANKQTAEANASAAFASLAQAHLTAPFDGTVGVHLVNVGNYVSVGTPLVNLEELDHLRVDFSVPENYAGQVKMGDKVEVTLSDNNNQKVTGSVMGIDTAIDQNTRLLSLQALVPNTSEQSLLPGGFAQVKLFYGPVSQAVVVPQEAVVNDGAEHEIYKVVNQHAKAVPITVGERFDDSIIVKSGLKPGDIIVTAGMLKLHDGAMVLDTAMMQKMPQKKK